MDMVKKKLERKIVDKKMILDTIEGKVKPQYILQFYYFASVCYHYWVSIVTLQYSVISKVSKFKNVFEVQTTFIYSYL